MIDVCHILPPAVVGYPGIDDHIGTRHLLLPSLMSSDRYRQFYRERAGIDWLTLDNGIAEGRLTGFSHLLAMARAANVQEIVLPDVLRDTDKTLNMLVRNFSEAFEHRARFQFMFVPQGKTINEVIHCAEQAMNMCPGIISTFGIPRHILGVSPSARAQIAWALRERFPTRDLHLLGTHPDDVVELSYYKNDFQALSIRSVDTSLAWNAALQSVQLKDPESLSYNLSIERQPIDQFTVASFDHADPRYVKIVRENMEAINSWVN